MSASDQTWKSRAAANGLRFDCKRQHSQALPICFDSEESSRIQLFLYPLKCGNDLSSNYARVKVFSANLNYTRLFVMSRSKNSCEVQVVRQDGIIVWKKRQTTRASRKQVNEPLITGW